jgi:elongator complex protein 3
MLKIYPTLVIKGTQLYDMWSKGEYEPYTTEDAVAAMAEMKRLVPPWARIQRIQRDIPAGLVEAGVDKGHLRELNRDRMRERGYQCRCIRCHEVGLKGIKDYSPQDVRMSEIEYDASGGREHFISLDLPHLDALVGYARLRTGDGDTAALRELKVFGRMVPLKRQVEGYQHRGFGKELVARAEERAREQGCTSLRVTSGVGVRPYYKSLGYEPDGVYVAQKQR